METFTQLQARHEELLARQETEADVVAMAREYIAHARRAASQISRPQERDQLRANLRYWSGYVYEHTGVYPNTELAPATPASSPKTGVASFRRLAIIALGFLFLLVALWGIFIRPTPPEEETPTAPVVFVSPSPSPSPAHTPTATSTPTPAPTPTPTPSPTPTPTPSLTPTADLTEVLETAGILVQVTNLQDGDVVWPEMTLVGSFRNLRPGWSIHVLLQPISAGGRLFPAAEYETVSPAAISGDWQIDVLFGRGEALARAEQYNIKLAVALDDAGRELLQEALETGFEEAPAQLLLFPQIITVTRGAYHHINETRLVYVEFFPERQNYELVTTRPDGSDWRQLTFRPRASKFDPHISPSGRQIVYVQRDAPFDATSSSIWIMDSGGQSHTQLLAEPDTIYERPAWSPDGRYIAYSASVAQRFSQIFLYDLLTGDVTQLTDNLFNSRFPSWLPTGEALVYNGFAPIPDSPERMSQALLLLDLESRASSLLFDNPAATITQPAVSPTGNLIAYISVRETFARELFILDLDTMEMRRLTADSDNQFPRWHPNGETIYFESSRSSIWAVDITGQNLRQISPVDRGQRITPDVGFMEAFLPLDTEG